MIAIPIVLTYGHIPLGQPWILSGAADDLASTADRDSAAANGAR